MNSLSPIPRNILGFSALVLVHYISDRYYLHLRTGVTQLLPYFLLLTLYAWIVFHNRLLFDRLFMRGRKQAYFLWTALMMTINSANAYLILTYIFNSSSFLPHIFSIWVYTFAGLGIFVLFNYVRSTPVEPSKKVEAIIEETGFLECTVDSIKEQIAFTTILYIESLENYIKVITKRKTYLTRLSMKETEDRLPRPMFLRISRSHIINTQQTTRLQDDAVLINEKTLKIGKVYKKYVESQLQSS